MRLPGAANKSRERLGMRREGFPMRTRRSQIMIRPHTLFVLLLFAAVVAPIGPSLANRNDSVPDVRNTPATFREIGHARSYCVDTTSTLARWSDAPRGFVARGAVPPGGDAASRPLRLNLTGIEGAGMPAALHDDEPLSVITPDGEPVCSVMGPMGPIPFCSTPETGCPGPDGPLMRTAARRDQTAIGAMIRRENL